MAEETNNNTPVANNVASEVEAQQQPQNGTIGTKPSQKSMNGKKSKNNLNNDGDDAASGTTAGVADSDLLKFGRENCPDTEPRGTPQIDIKCGPLLRYLGMRDQSSHIWRGTIMVVTNDDTSDYQSAPTISFAVKDSSSAGSDDNAAGDTSEVSANRIFQEYGVSFWRFEISFTLKDEAEQSVTYIVNNDTEHQYTFYIPAYNQTMNVMFHSCNGFSLGVDPEEFKNSLWTDVLDYHNKQHYHVMLGGGDQIYSDSLLSSCPSINKWSKETNPIKKRQMKFSDDVKEEVENYYLWHYMGWFGHGHWLGVKGETLQPKLPEAMAQIPMINIYDDHDIIDGFGSYSEHTMKIPIFNAIGNTASKYYMLFQNQCAPDEDFSTDPSWVNGREVGPYIKQKSHSIYARLGSSIGFFGLDCRTERRHDQVVRKETYNQMFERIRKEVKSSNGEIDHLLIMLGVPFAYPRLVFLETLLSSSVMTPLKKLAKHGLFGGVLNQFDGSIEILDDLDDHWCAKHHKHERNNLVKNLMSLAKELGVRITVLSGDVHLAGIGRFYSTDKKVAPENDPNLMLNVISSAIVNTPPPSKMADFLNKRNKIHHLSHHVHEDMVPLFIKDVDGSDRNNQRLLPRRNWCSIIKRNEEATNESKIPGPQWDDAVGSKPSSTGAGDKEYADLADSLSVTLHLEKDQMDPEAGSMPYEIIVPSLKLNN